MPEPASPEDLYAIDPASFTAERNALAKRLRAQGRRDDAARVGRLRRPPATAWALNRVARSQPALVRAALDAGARLRSAMEDALGGDASGLRRAQAEQRVAIGAVVDAATTGLEGAGHRADEAARRRMAESVRAATLDDTAAGQLQAGTLDADRTAPGFGLSGLDPGEAAPAPPRGVEERPRDPQRDAKGAQRTHLAAEAERSSLRDRELVDKAEEAESVAAGAQRAADAAALEAARARQVVEEADAVAQAARQAAEKADAVAQAARQAAEKADAVAQAARQAAETAAAEAGQRREAAGAAVREAAAFAESAGADPASDAS